MKREKLTAVARGRGVLGAAAAAPGTAALALALALSAACPAAASASTHAGARAAAVRTNCVAGPSSCGFPDAANTGVPAGMTLLAVPGQVSSGRGWHFDRRGWVTVNGKGAVLSRLYIPYNLNISASGVTVQDVRVVSSGRSSFGISVRQASNVTIEHSTISGVNAGARRLMVGIKDIYGGSTGLTVLDNNIFQAGTGVQMESGLIQGNYIHNMGYLRGDHLDGIHSDGGRAGLLTIRDNTILLNHNQTGAVVLSEDNGAQANRIVTGNLLAGGGYTVYAGQDRRGPAAIDVKVTGNRISALYYPRGGQYGPVTAFNAGGKGDIWSGNVWDTTGQAIPAP